MRVFLGTILTLSGAIGFLALSVNLIFGETGDQQANFGGALVCALLTWVGYGKTRDARRELRATGEVPFAASNPDHQSQSMANNSGLTMDSKGGGTEKPPTQLQSALSGIGRFVSTLGVLGLFLFMPIAKAVGSGLAMNIAPALVTALLVYLAYRSANDARRAPSAAGEGARKGRTPFQPVRGAFNLTFSFPLMFFGWWALVGPFVHLFPYRRSIVILFAPPLGALSIYVGYRSAQYAFRMLRSSGPEPAEAVASGAQSRRGFAWWAKHILIVVVLVVIAAAFGIPAYHGFRPRALISEAVADGAALRTPVAEFYERHRRLPLDAEAKAFQVAPSDLKRAQSVVWDAAGRRIVVTAGDPQPGKRFAFYAEEREGALIWTCRSIDLDVKYLPGSCR